MCIRDRSGISTFTGQVGFGTHITLPDHAKLKVGTHEDIEIYNKGNLSIIANKASGASSNNNPLHIYSFFDVTHGSGFSQYFRVGNLVGQESSGAGDSALNLISGGAVQAFFDGTKRFETTNTGAIVTGVLTATSFVGSGALLTGIVGGKFNGPAAGILTTSTVGIQTADVTSADLVGAATSMVGLYIGDGHLLFSNYLNKSGGYYITTGLNALNAGPVTLGSTMSLDGTWVIV